MSKFSIDKNTEKDYVEDEIDLREIAFRYLSHWKWFVLSIVVFMIIGTIIYLKSDRQFQVSTSVLLKENKGGTAAKSNTLGSLEELGLISTTNNVDNEIAVFSSPNLMEQIVETLELQTTYYEDGFFRDTEVYKKCPYYVRLDDMRAGDLKGSLSISIKRGMQDKVIVQGIYSRNKEEIEISSESDSLPCFIKLPEDLGRLYITLRPNITYHQNETSYIINIQNSQRVASSLSKQIQISPTSKSASVLNISLPTLNVDKGIDVLTEMVKIYNLNNVQENNEMAVNTSSFINDRLTMISKELSEVEDEVVSYKKQQRITDLSSEAKIYVEQTSQIEEKRIEIETQIKTIELIENFIRNLENSYKLIPNLGIEDPGLVSIITEYNNLLLSYQRLERSVSEDNPARRKNLADLNSTRLSIQGAVLNMKSALNIGRNEINRQSSQLSNRIQSVPTMEKGLLEITRQQQIKQALYLYLMQVREETNITMASTADKAKVITNPIIPDSPVSPKKNIIYLASLLIGVLIPIIIIYIRELLQLNIKDREELEKLSKVTIVGEIMKKEESDVIVVAEDKTTPIVELFRTLRNNVKFILDEPDKKVVLVTSTIPGEGKTFVSINLATSFALSDKKVLLIGMDIRNPKLAEEMNFTKGIGLSSYLSGNEYDWTSLLAKLDSFPCLDILQAGAIPPNPNELLMKPALSQLLKEAREIYDVIIIDSAPIGVVSDTFLIASLADTTIYVTREGVTPKNAVSFINEVHVDNKLPEMYLVLNGVEPSKNKGRYGRYGYGYTYGYGERDK